MELELRFRRNYPDSAPRIRVVRPRLECKNPTVTKAGTISLDILNRAMWTPEVSVEMILLNILVMCFEDARLDMSSWNVKYSLEEAQEQFDQMDESV